ncbi:TetR/AcrR family transcriptional regulator [Streptomyces sp. NPDC059781]|uniref:TetR/AcrR family transcriptional regulator n=1 Tax=unclassified Streptomyces TaxID=2593676 RepID=UPI00365A970F
MQTGPSRRERMRAALEREARDEARRLTAAHGVEGLSLSAVARAVGVSPPALYRHFDGRKGLILAVCEDLTDEFVSAVSAAVRREDPEDLGARLYAATRAVLDWSVAHPAEFDLLMGAGHARLSAESAVDQVLARRLGGLFGELFGRLWERGGLDFPSDDEIDPALHAQMLAYRRVIGQEFPAGVALLMVTCWRQLYGLLCMSVYSHLATAFDDCVPLFEHMVDDLLALLGVACPPERRRNPPAPEPG